MHAVKQDYRDKNDGKLPSRKQHWQLVLEDVDLKNDFLALTTLKNASVPVEGVIADLYNFASKDIHTFQFDKVFLDTSKFTLNQLKVAEALCKDYPIGYVIGHTNDLLQALLKEDDGNDQTK